MSFNLVILIVVSEQAFVVCVMYLNWMPL